MSGLYIHFPFCHSKCAYCDFYSMPGTKRIDEFIDRVAREYELRRHEIVGPIQTIYFGGGTPSIVDIDRLSKLCAQLPVSDAVEFTIEANPEDISLDKVKAWKNLGINRVSMGVQSFDDQCLEAINRRHTAAEAHRAIATLLDAGIDNLTCDLIYGLPNQTIDSWLTSLRMMLDYDLPHLSAYCLSYEPGTALYARMLAGKVTPTPDEILLEMYGALCEQTAAAGYEHYEISNFAKSGCRSRHNSSYWNRTPYLGLGPGAHSFDSSTRRFNPSNLKQYLGDEFPIAVIDSETPVEQTNDTIITSLRTSDGLNISDLSDRAAAYVLEQARPFIAKSEVTFDDRVLRIDERSWFVSDSILRELILPDDFML